MILNCPWDLIMAVRYFLSHYSFLGFDPRGFKDRYADYWEQNKNHTLINRAYCIDNPKEFKGYGEKCWGLTASDSYIGYAAHSPTEDLRCDLSHCGPIIISLYTGIFYAGIKTFL